MPRYYFDILDADGMRRDDIGRLCDDLDGAVAQAQMLLPDIVRAEMPDGDWHDLCCDVRSDDGMIVYQGELTYRGRRLYG